jgi:hypothetical protein
MYSSSAIPAGALCALHPDRQAVGTCRRCGNFACGDCNQNGAQTLCPTCSLLLGPSQVPFSRENYDFSQVFDFAFNRFRPEWLNLTLAMLIFVFGSVVGSVVAQGFQMAGAVAGKDSQVVMIGLMAVGQVLGFFINLVIQGFLQLGLYRLFFDVIEGRKLDLGQMFTQVDKLLRHVGIQLVVAVGSTLVLMLLLVVPMVLVGVALASSGAGLEDGMKQVVTNPLFWVAFVGVFVVFLPVVMVITIVMQFASLELVYSNCGALEAIGRAWRLGEGHRMTLLLYYFMSGMLALVGVIAFCVGIIPAMALGQLFIATTFQTLRNGSGLPTPDSAVASR